MQREVIQFVPSDGLYPSFINHETGAWCDGTCMHLLPYTRICPMFDAVAVMVLLLGYAERPCVVGAGGQQLLRIPPEDMDH